MCWSIPAPAGEPSAHQRAAPPTWVYPRACGGTQTELQMDHLWDGLSPRLRGNHDLPRRSRLPGRSIPAPAGEPVNAMPIPAGQGVYPRACGGTPSGHHFVPRGRGLSPRLRGNQRHREQYSSPFRSIPAPAGEPTLSNYGGWPPEVYPRACGGTSLWDSAG